MSKECKVILVNAPFASINYPSIQVGLLKAELEVAGILADTFYANVEFAKYVGVQFYGFVSYALGPQFGEWLFTKAAFPEFDRANGYTDHFAEWCKQIGQIFRMPPERLAFLREK